MKIFTVKENFKDKNTEIKYVKDDLYNSKDVDQTRIDELSSTHNNKKKVLIEEKKLTELSAKQLVQYVEIIGMDIREIIINALDIENKDIKDNKNKDSNKENKKDTEINKGKNPGNKDK